MSTKMTDLVWADPSVTNMSDRFVLLALADCHNPKLGCFPSMKVLMQKTCMSERGIQTSIARLVSIGKISRTIGGGRKKHNTYIFNYQTPHTVQGLEDKKVSLEDEKPRMPCVETPHAVRETPHAVHPNPACGAGIPIGETENSEPPNRNRTVIYNRNIREDAVASPLPQNADARYHDFSEQDVDEHKGTNQSPSPHRLNGNSEGHAEPADLFHGGDKPEEPAKPKTKRVTKEKGPPVEIPLSLNTPEFLEAFNELKTERIARRLPVSAVWHKRTMNQCVKWGVEASLEAIDYCIRRGDRGLYDPRDRVSRTGSNSTRNLRTDEEQLKRIHEIVQSDE